MLESHYKKTTKQINHFKVYVFELSSRQMYNAKSLMFPSLTLMASGKTTLSNRGIC